MNPIMDGKAHVFGNNINTDYIISGKYKFKSTDMKELSVHLPKLEGRYELLSLKELKV